MSSSAIKSKRQERKQRIQLLEDQIAKIEKDTMYSSDYKNQQIKNLREQLAIAKQQFDTEIKALVQQSKTQALKEIDEAQYAMTPEQVNKQLLIEMRNQAQADTIYNKYRSSGISDRDSFWQEAEYAVANNLSTAGAYVLALRKLNHEKANQFEQQYKVNNLSQVQKMHYEALEAIEAEEKAYEVDVISETDPLRAALMSHYIENPEKQ